MHMTDDKGRYIRYKLRSIGWCFGSDWYRHLNTLNC